MEPMEGMEVVDTKEEDVSDVNLDNSLKIVELEARKKYLQKHVEEQYEVGNKMKQVFKNPIEDYDIDEMITNKLSDYSSKDIEERYNDKEWIDWLYTIPETGELVGVNSAIPPERIYEYKIEYALFVKRTEETMEGIDKEYEKLNEAQKEFDEGTREAYLALSSNVLAYTQTLKEKFNDNPVILEKCKYIESGYTMEVLNEVLDNNPSVIKHTLEDMKSERRIKEIGKRYMDKLKQGGVTASLMVFLSGEKVDGSLEYKCLPKGDYEEGREDLFIFSCIRYFAMAHWNTDSNVSKFHASLIVMLKQLMSGELEGESKDLVIESIGAYLFRFRQ